MINRFKFEEFAQVIIIVCSYLLDGLRFLDEFHNSIVFTAGQALESCEGKVDVNLSQNLVEQGN